jgi:hypothetical protein
MDGLNVLAKLIHKKIGNRIILQKRNQEGMYRCENYYTPEQIVGLKRP